MDWRERVARLYLSDVDLAGFRAARDELFRTHPQSAIPPTGAAAFTGLRYFPPNAAAVAEVPVRPATGGMDIDTGGPDGVVHYRRVGVADTPWGPLTLWWIEAYGGGLFLPFRDGTCGARVLRRRALPDRHGQGHLRPRRRAARADRVRLDFNYAYNPSCAYDDRWACPLAPEENRLAPPIEAGELNYHD